MHRLWIIAGSIFTVVVLAAGSYTAVNAMAHEEVEAHRAVSADGVDEIVVRTTSGHVEVVGDPTATEIEVDATIRHGLRRTDFSVTERGGRLFVDGTCNHFLALWCRVDVTLRVPADIPLDIGSSNGGIEVTDVDAGVVAKTSNGSVSLIGLGGDVDARTSNGTVRGHGLDGDAASAKSSNGRIELTFASPPRRVEATTSNGSVEITVPEDDTAYAIDTDASSNSSTEITVRTDPASDHTIAAKTSNGSISVFYPTS